VNIHGDGVFFFVQYQVHNKVFCEDTVDSEQKWKQIMQGDVASAGRQGCGRRYPMAAGTFRGDSAWISGEEKGNQDTGRDQDSHFPLV